MNTAYRKDGSMKKVVVITGASSGMGKASALKLLEDGHIVYGLARRVENMREIEEAGGEALQLDVTNPEQIKEIVNRIIQEQGKIDVLWNNAGYSVMGAVEDVTLSDARHLFEVNLFGVAAMTKAVLPFMRDRRSGTVIITSSVGGKIFTPLASWYHASKHAIEGWSDCLRMELKAFNIDVVLLQPGGIATEFSDVLIRPFIERSKNSAYKELVDITVRSYRKFDENNTNADPSVIGDTVARIINSSKPRTRYSAGTGAGMMLMLRWLLSDRMFERLTFRIFDGR